MGGKSEILKVIGVFAIIAGISLALTAVYNANRAPVAAADPNAEFTAAECSAFCKPLPVISFFPGFCHIQNEKHYFQRCVSSTGTTNSVHISDICTCGQMTK